MSRVQLETRRYTRAGAAFGVVGGIGLGVAGVLHATNPGTNSARLAGASAHLLAFGLLGAVWLAALLRLLSSQPSRAAVKPVALSAVFVLWNGTVIFTAAATLTRGPFEARLVLPAPYLASAAALAIALLVIPVLVRRLAPVAPVGIHHVGAAACLVLGLGLADLAYATGDVRLAAGAALLVVGGWAPLAGIGLFYNAFDYEAYEERRWPLISAAGAGAAAVLRFAFAYDIVNAEGLRLFTTITGFAIVIGMVAVLRQRWRGGLATWFERVAFAGVVVTVIGIFVRLEGFLGTPVGPQSGGAGALVSPSLYGALIPWALAWALFLDQRDLRPRQARFVLWPLTLGSVAYAGLLQLSDAIVRNDGLRDGLLLACSVAIGLGVLVACLHILRRPRLRAVR